MRWLRPGPVLLCARRDTELCDETFLIQVPAARGIELCTFGLQQVEQRSESDTLAASPVDKHFCYYR